jgi:ABC-2 type transport system permease protein
MRESLRVIGEMIRKEFYQIRQDRRMLAVSIVAPVLQVILLGYAATTDITNSAMVVCDMDRTEQSREFIRRFTTSDYFIDRYRVERPADVDGYIERARATIALIIPAEFGRKLLSREPAAVQIVLDGTDANSSNILLGYASQIIGSYSLSSQGCREFFLSPESGSTPI